MDPIEVVDFVVRGLDDRGKPSQQLLQVTEVGVMNDRGKLLRRFRDADSLANYLFKLRGKVWLVALETTGLPRRDISGKFVCYEQAWTDAMVERRRH